MTLEDILVAIERHKNNFVKITLTNQRVVKGILKEAYKGYPLDPRGYTEDYFYTVRIDKSPNITEKFNCEEALSIEAI